MSDFPEIDRRYALKYLEQVRIARHWPKFDEKGWLKYFQGCMYMPLRRLNVDQVSKVIELKEYQNWRV